MIKLGYFAIFASIALAFALTVGGCANTVEKTYYENGQLKSERNEQGWNPMWSDGASKNLPLSNPSFSVINAGK